MSVQSVLFVHLAFLYGPPPHAPGEFMRDGSPCTHRCRRSALHPGDFRFTTKVTKGVSGGMPPEPPEGDASLPLRQAAPPRKGNVPLT